MDKDRVRKNIYLKTDLAEYLEQQSEGFGMSQSAYINMVLYQYRQQAQALSDMSKIETLINRMEQLSSSNSLK